MRERVDLASRPVEPASPRSPEPAIRQPVLASAQRPERPVRVLRPRGDNNHGTAGDAARVGYARAYGPEERQLVLGPSWMEAEQCELAVGDSIEADIGNRRSAPAFNDDLRTIRVEPDGGRELRLRERPIAHRHVLRRLVRLRDAHCERSRGCLDDEDEPATHSGVRRVANRNAVAPAVAIQVGLQRASART